MSGTIALVQPTDQAAVAQPAVMRPAPAPSPGTFPAVLPAASPRRTALSSASASCTARPTAWTVVSLSRCAPPNGSATIRSTSFKPQQILGGQLQRLGGDRRLRLIAPQDRCAALRRDHRIDRVLQHQDPVAGRQRDRAAGSALTDDRRDDRHRRFQAGLDRAGDGLGLAARLRLDAGKGAGGVDEGQDRQAETAGEFHQPARLAIALGPRHAEIMLHPGFGIDALLGAEHHHRAALEPAHAAQHRGIVGEGAVAGQRGEAGDQRVDVVLRLRPIGMAGDLGFLPRGQLGVGGAELLVGDRGQAADFVGDIDAARLRHPPQLLDLAFEFGDGFFEIEEMAHGAGALAQFTKRDSLHAAGVETARATNHLLDSEV